MTKIALSPKVFGRATWHQDLGGHQFGYTYNAAGWLVRQTGDSGQSIATDYYANGAIKSVWDQATGAYSHYAYDANGNRVFEGYAVLKHPADLDGGVLDYYQRARLDYDELGRLVHVVDSQIEIGYEFDAAGNRRHVVSRYRVGTGSAPPPVLPDISALFACRWAPSRRIYPYAPKEVPLGDTAFGHIRLSLRVRLHAAKVNSAGPESFSRPLWRVLRNPPTVLIQPKASSIIFRRSRLISCPLPRAVRPSTALPVLLRATWARMPKRSTPRTNSSMS